MNGPREELVFSEIELLRELVLMAKRRDEVLGEIRRS